MSGRFAGNAKGDASLNGAASNSSVLPAPGAARADSAASKQHKGGGMSADMFSRYVTAIQKVGLPAVVCLILLFIGYRLGERFLNQQEKFLDSAITGQNSMVAVQQTHAELMKRVTENQEILTKSQEILTKSHEALTEEVRQSREHIDGMFEYIKQAQNK